MTYLNPVRLHFAGQFQADPSTVNNDVRHFDTPEFQPGWQQLSDNAGPNGWWNPDGSGSWRLVGIKVTSVAVPPPPAGSPANPTPDPAIGLQVASNASRVAGKIVDLDPYQQGCSQIWGLDVRLTDGATDFFSGPFAVAPFADLWNRAQASTGDVKMGTFWQSVIGPVTIDNSINSPVLQQLAAASPTGMLSIKFNVDGYNNHPRSTGFTLGRCVGTIGPALADEPQHFVLGRQLFPTITFNPQTGLPPLGPMYFMQAVVDETTSTIYADFGNSLPTITPGSDLAPIGDVAIGYLDANDNFYTLGTLAETVYSAPGWYEQTAGIVEFPLQSQGELAQAQSLRLGIQVTKNSDRTLLLRENQDGLHCRADDFVYRLNPGEPAQVTVWASQYGKPLANAPISVSFDPSQLAGGAPNSNDPLTMNITAPPVATPTNAIWVGDTRPTDATDPWPNATIATGSSGNVTLTINSADPGNARPFVNSSNPNSSIDGQVYGVRCMNAEVAKSIGNPPNFFSLSNPLPTFGFNPSDVISLLVWSGYPMPASGVTPQWSDVAPILAQYSVLYPVMDQLIDLTNQQEVNAQAQLLYLAFSLPMTDPNSMPVTRDLSDAKRATLLAYLAAQTSISPTVTGAAPQGKPVEIQRRRAAAPPPAPPGAPSGAAPDSEVITPRDSKTIAMRNRLGNKK